MLRLSVCLGQSREESTKLRINLEIFFPAGRHFLPQPDCFIAALSFQTTDPSILKIQLAQIFYPSPIMKLYLIRHAESANNASWGNPDSTLYSRTPDPDITETGHRQAKLLAEHLSLSDSEPRQINIKSGDAPDFNIKHLYCSLMTRSVQTASYIGERLGISPTALWDIFERKGLYDIDGDGNLVGVPGPGKSYFMERFPSLVLPSALSENGWWNQPVETNEAFFLRVEQSLESIISRHNNSDDSIALVVHGDYLDQCINYLMQVPRKAMNYETPWVANWVFHNTSVSRVDIQQNARNVVYLNRIDHLPSEHVTW